MIEKEISYTQKNASEHLVRQYNLPEPYLYSCSLEIILFLFTFESITFKLIEIENTKTWTG